VFEDPRDDSGSFIDPGRYVIKIVKLEPQPPSDLHPDWKPSVRVILNLATYPGMDLKRDSQGEPYEWWQYLSVAMGKGTKTRQKVEAFLGRELVEGQDTGAAIAEALIGAKAIAMIGPNEKGKDAILGALQPFKAPAKAGKAAPVSAAVATLEDDLPPDQRTGAVAVAEPEDEFAF
jgi:hypothetical protein